MNLLSEQGADGDIESLARLLTNDDLSTIALYNYNNSSSVEEHVDRGKCNLILMMYYNAQFTI
jgi:hypothetical protein